MYDMSDHIQNKLIHLQWQIGTYQSHIKYIQGQIRLIHHLIHLVIVLLNFRFQKCRDPNPRLDPVDGSKPEPGLLRHFQLSSQNILFVLFHFILFNYAEALHYGQAHKHLQLTKCIYEIMPLYPHILILFIFACFHFTNHLSYHSMHFQCNNSIHNSIYEI